MEVCAGCQTSLGYGQIFTVGESSYHPACFKCADCRKVLLATDDFMSVSGAIYCAACAPSRTMAGYCGTCGAQLTTDYLQIRTAKFHPNCFVCVGCGNTFGEQGFAEIDGDVWCAACVTGQNN